MFAPGCEEVEGLTIVDVLRRMRIETTMVGLEDLHVPGAHGIELTCDEVMSDRLLNYDVVAFPGGRGGAQKLRDNDKLMKLMQKRNAENKWDAAMCAAPRALARYGVLADADFTCYPGIEEECLKDAPSAHFSEKIAVTDKEHKILTSRGPATAWAFAYSIAEALGVDTSALKKGMLYNYLADNIQDSL